MRNLITPLLITIAILCTTPARADIGDQLAKLLPLDGESEAHFGFSVAIRGSTAIIGAHGDATKGIESGAAYLFDTPTGQQFAKILPITGSAFDNFGFSVALSNTTAIVGAPGDDENGNNSGSAFLFNSTTGLHIATLLSDDGTAIDAFGYSVGIGDTIAIVGAPWADNGVNSGSAYLFNTTTGQQITKLLPDDGWAEADKFGASVAISGSIAIVGVFGDDNNGFNSGSAYLFDTTTGKQIAKLLPNDGMPSDWFGFSVATTDKVAIVGAIEDDNSNGQDAGSAYLFDTTTGDQIAKILANDGQQNDLFGISVGISDGIVIIGAIGDTSNGYASGSSYLFDISEPGRP